MKTPIIAVIATVALIQATAFAAPPTKGQPRLPAPERERQEYVEAPTMCAQCLALQKQGSRGPVMVAGRECDPSKRCQIVRKTVTRGNGKTRGFAEECVCV